MKFSLLTLLGVVAVAAMACAALTHPVQGSVIAVVTAVLLLLASAVPTALESTGAVRAFWRGFSILGWGYLLVVWFVSVSPNTNELSTDMSERLLATSSVLDIWADAMVPTVSVPPSPPAQPGYLAPPDSAETVLEPDAYRRLLVIGHALWALLFAFAGGVLARWLYLRRERHS